MSASDQQSPFVTLERPRPEESDTEAELDRLQTRHTDRDPVEVRAYLRTYPHLISILVEATQVIPPYFGEDAPLALEVSIDPEGDSDAKELCALVQTKPGASDTSDRLRRLDDDWWIDRSPNGPGVLVVSTESR